MTAVERADVCIIVIDATEGVTEQDAKIAGIAHAVSYTHLDVYKRQIVHQVWSVDRIK